MKILHVPLTKKLIAILQSHNGYRLLMLFVGKKIIQTFKLELDKHIDFREVIFHPATWQNREMDEPLASLISLN